MNFWLAVIHSIYIPASSYSGLPGGLSLSQMPLGERWGTPWTGNRCITGSTQRQTTMHAHTRSYDQFRIDSEPDIHALRLWKEAWLSTEVRDFAQTRCNLLHLVLLWYFGTLVFATFCPATFWLFGSDCGQRGCCKSVILFQLKWKTPSSLDHKNFVWKQLQIATTQLNTLHYTSL